MTFEHISSQFLFLFHSFIIYYFDKEGGGYNNKKKTGRIKSVNNEQTGKLR